MSSINTDLLEDLVYSASKAAFSSLVATHPDQTFYAFGLFTDDSLQFLHPSANTEEALAATVSRYRETVDPQYGGSTTRSGMRWSYGDWGFFAYEDGGHFNEINRILMSRFDDTTSDEDFHASTRQLWAVFLRGFRRLNSEGFFGKEQAQSKVTLLLVGDLDSDLANAWVAVLNPPDVVHHYLDWDCNAADTCD